MAIPDNFPSIYFAPHKKHCERCGRLIPNSGYQVDEDGSVVVDDDGHAIFRQTARLVCECLRELKPPAERKPRLKKGEPRDPNQMALDLRKEQ